LLVLGTWFGPLRSGGASLFAPLQDAPAEQAARLQALGLSPLGPSPAERLLHNARARLQPRELRSLPGIGAGRALEIEAARERASQGLPWTAWAGATGLGALGQSRLAEYLAQRSLAGLEPPEPP
jgi:hypothetical protein